jgi:CDP-diacylglycerol pyrophosphatase
LSVTFSRRLFAVIVCICSTAMVAVAIAGEFARDRLRLIVQQQCVRHWLESHDPAPCVSVNTVGKGPLSDGFAVLHDLKGGAHFLLIPTRTITGIESVEARAPGALNYFDAAWRVRGVLATTIGHPLPRSAVGLAVNSIHSRSQDELHIHISCLRPLVYRALEAQASRIGDTWSGISIGLWHYQAIRIQGAELGTTNPFVLLANLLPGAQDSMSEYTLLVAGAQFQEGPGFIVLAGRDEPAAELLLDSTCAVGK